MQFYDCRNGGSSGLVPASLLALTDVNSLEGEEISEEEKMALSIVSLTHQGFYNNSADCMHR